MPENLEMTDKIQMIFDSTDNEKLDGIHIAMYLFKDYQQNVNIKKAVLLTIISIIYVLIPIIVKSAINDESFFCKENYIIFGLSFLPTLILKRINLELLTNLIVLLDTKNHFK
jgi:hypothetical protein